MNQPINKLTGLRGFFTKNPRVMTGGFGAAIGAGVAYEYSKDRSHIGRRSLIGAGIGGAAIAALPPKRGEQALEMLGEILG